MEVIQHQTNSRNTLSSVEEEEPVFDPGHETNHRQQHSSSEEHKTLHLSSDNNETPPQKIEPNLSKQVDHKEESSEEHIDKLGPPVPKGHSDDLSISEIYPKNAFRGNSLGTRPQDNLDIQNQEESFDYRPYSNSILFKGDNEDSAWLGDGFSALGGLHEEIKHNNHSSISQKQDLYGRVIQSGAQTRQNPMQRANTVGSNTHNDSETSHVETSIDDISSQSLSSSRSRVYTDTETSQIMWTSDVYKVIQERKKEALIRLKEWEEARVKVLNDHRAICEYLFQGMKRKIEISKNGIQGLFIFFIERIKQEESFTKTVMKNIPKLEGLFENPREKNESKGLAKIFQENDFYHQKCINRGNIMAKHIERAVIQEILVQEEKRYNDIVNPLLENFRKLRRNLNKENERALRLGKAYLEIYKKSLNYTKTKEDLYVFELKFLKQAQMQLITQRKLGEYTAQIIQETKKNEIIRFENCTKALKVYLSKMNELYSVGNEPFVIKLIDEFDSQKESDSNYLLDSLLRKDHLALISKSFPEVPQLTAKEVIEYLKGLIYPFLAVSPLVFCESKTSVEKDSQLVGTVNSIMAVTVDANIVVYDLDLETRDFKVHREMKVKSITIKERSERNNIVEFSEARRRFLGKVTRHIQLTFHDNEEKLLFLRTVEFLCGRKV